MYILVYSQQVIKDNYSFNDLKRENPSVSFPQIAPDSLLEEYGVFKIDITPPSYNEATQVASLSGYTYNNVSLSWEPIWMLRYKTLEESNLYTQKLQDVIIRETQKRLDDFAKTRNYDGILSACTYATSSTPKFASEGQYAVNARDNTWATLYNFMTEVQTGTAQMPTSFTDVEPLLPELVWPN